MEGNWKSSSSLVSLQGDNPSGGPAAFMLFVGFFK